VGHYGVCHIANSVKEGLRWFIRLSDRGEVINVLLLAAGGQISSVCVRRGGCAKHFLSYSQSASIVLS